MDDQSVGDLFLAAVTERRMLSDLVATKVVATTFFLTCKTLVFDCRWTHRCANGRCCVPGCCATLDEFLDALRG